MTSDQLREWLDAHGVNGAPTVPGWYVVQCRAGRVGVGVNTNGRYTWSTMDRHAGEDFPTFEALASSDCTRHAPLRLLEAPK